MKTTKLYINDEEYAFRTLRYSDYVAQIGSFNGELDKIHSLNGLSTVRIEEDGETVFQGILEQPDKSFSPSGPEGNISGAEWTARLMHHPCPQDTTIDGLSITNALGTVLTNSPFVVGDVDGWDSELDPTVYDEALEILPFTFTNTCIVYTTTEEIQDVTDAGTYRLTRPNMRCTFYSKSTGYFYILAYDTANSLLKYNSTNDGASWKGWTSLGFDIGVNGYYSIVWDESNGRLFLLCDDGAGNVDFYQYSEAGGTLTQTDTDNNVATNATLEVGPEIDDEGDVWFIAFDSVDVGNEWELWQFDYSSSTWTEEEDWDDANNDDPKFLFRGNESYDDHDMIIIVYDGDNDDLLEWLWDNSGGAIDTTPSPDNTAVVVIDSADMSGDNGIGYVSGYQDSYGNMFVIVEELDSGGGSYLTFSYRYVNDLDDYNTWEAIETAVTSANHQTEAGFSLGGDGADNLYLWYLLDTTGAQVNLNIIRRFEGTWETTVDTGYDLDNIYVSAPASGLAQYVVYENGDDDIGWMLLSPYGVCVTREFDFPYFSEDLESVNNFSGSVTSTDCTVVGTNTSYPYSGTKNVKCVVPANRSGNHAHYYEYLGIAGSWGERVNISAKNVRWNTELENNGDRFWIISSGRTQSGMGAAYAGVYRSGGVDYWEVYYYDNGLTQELTATEATPNVNHRVELAIYRDNSNGYVYLWVDGALVANLTSKDTLQAGDRYLNYARFGLHYADSPGTTDLILYMDDCRVSYRRIDESDEVTGVYQTSVISAGGSFSAWGTLQSTDVDIYNVKWDVEDDVAVDLVTDISLPADLDEEGVDPAETDIVIEANLTQRGESTTYIVDIQVGEKGGEVYSYHDAENTYQGIEKLAGQFDAEFKLRYDDTVDFLDELGEDKSDTIELFTARSQSLFPDLKPTLMVIRRNPDWGYYANCILVIGGTPSGGSRVYATAKDANEIATMSERLGGSHNGEIWYTVRDPELLTTSTCQNRANAEKAARVSVYEQIVGIVTNSDLIDGAEIGDTITLHDRWTDTDETARIMGLTVNYDGRGNKSVNLDLLKVARSSSLNRHIGSINDLKRYATQ